MNSFCFCRLLEDWSAQNPAPNTVNRTTQKKFIWDCSKCGSSYEATPFNRFHYGTGCHNCANPRKIPGSLGLLVDVRPDLVEEFDETANTVSVSTLTCGSKYKAVWRCKECHCQWTAPVFNRVALGKGCPQSSCMQLKRQRTRWIDVPRVSE